MVGLPAACLAALLLGLWWIGLRETRAGATGRKGEDDPAGTAGARAGGGGSGVWGPARVMAGPLRRCLLVLLPAIAVLASLQLHNAYSLNTDDAPITFRYAENLATGHGFVYNDGEHVLGTSTPLFTLALAALRVLGVPIELASLLLSLLAVAAVAALVLRIGALVAGPAGGLIAASLALTEAPFLVYTTQGMETACFTALILGALLCHLEGREQSCAMLAALCAVMRLDGLSVAAALGLGYAAERRLPSRRAIALFIIVLAPWLVFLYFGHVLPQSLLAKVHHVKYAGRFWMLRYLLREENLLFVPIGLLGAFRVCASERGPRSCVAAAWVVSYAGAYSLVPIDAYPWYRIPLAPVLAVLGACGLSAIAEGWFRIWPRGRRLAVAAVLAAALPWAAARYGTYRESLGQYADQLRVWETPRVAAASWLRDHAPAGSRVATSAIGHIGWISGLRILDTSGLVSPELVGGFDLDRARPEFVVGHDGDPQPGAVFKIDHPAYQLVQSFAVESSVVYRIYKRTDIVLR